MLRKIDIDIGERYLLPGSTLFPPTLSLSLFFFIVSILSSFHYECFDRSFSVCFVQSTEPGTSNCGIDSSTDEASSMPIDDLSSSHPISLDCDSQCPTTHLSTPIAIAASSTGFENEESIDDISHLPLPNRVDFSLIDSFFEKNASRDAKISMSLPSFLSNYYALHSEVPDPATAEATKKGSLFFA